MYPLPENLDLGMKFDKTECTLSSIDDDSWASNHSDLYDKIGWRLVTMKRQTSDKYGWGLLGIHSYDNFLFAQDSLKVDDHVTFVFEAVHFT